MRWMRAAAPRHSRSRPVSTSSDAPAAEALRRAGCETVWVGAESGSQGVLDAMDKGTRVEQIYEATRLLRQQGIRIGYFLQFGYPGENWSDIAQTLAMVRKAQPDDIGISVSYPLPGTALPRSRRTRAGGEDQLGPQRRPRGDVPRHVPPAVLPGALSLRAP